MGENIEREMNTSVEVRGNKGYLFSKRLIDIVGSLFGLLICLPVIAILSIIIKLEDGGPIIFKQIRVGKDGEEFYMVDCKN